MASSAAQDEIFRADKQLDPSRKTRNFSSFHKEQGGPIVHMSRPPLQMSLCTLACGIRMQTLMSARIRLRFIRSQFSLCFVRLMRSRTAVVRSSLAITEYGISNTQEERPDGGRKMVWRHSERCFCTV
jgi:hypothetical protein